MIRVHKPAKPPRKLSSTGRIKAQSLCDAYTTDPQMYSGKKNCFTFDAQVYGDKTVKRALVKAQHGKCCFCETKIGFDGDVEHFRPKAAYRQTWSQNLVRPGYYWLVYEWNNLVLSCPACNQRFKRNLFPLLQEHNRALNHNYDIANEEPLLINPAQEDPEQFISFREEIPYPLKGSKRGRVTIQALGLKREIMNERRRSHLKLHKILQDFVTAQSTKSVTPEMQDVLDDAKRHLATCTNDDAEFAGMMRALTRGY